MQWLTSECFLFVWTEVYFTPVLKFAIYTFSEAVKFRHGV